MNCCSIACLVGYASTDVSGFASLSPTYAATSATYAAVVSNALIRFT